MDKRLGFILFVVVIAGLTYLEVPAWHGGQSAVVMTPSVAVAPAATATAENAPAAPTTDNSVAANPAPAEPAPATPVAPAAEAVTAAPIAPTFDVVRVEPSGDATAAGQADPGSKVEVLDGSAPIATAKADDSGAWALALDKPLTPGSHDLALRTTSKDQAVATLSDQRVTVSVPGKGSKDVLVVLDQPNAPSKVMEVPKAAESPPTVDVAKLEPPAPTDEVQAAPSPTADEKMSATSEAPIAAEPPVVAEPPVKAEPPIATEAPATTEPAIAAQPPSPSPVIALAEPPPDTAPAVAPVALPPTPQVVVGAVEADTAGSIYVGGTAATGETVRVYLDDKPLGDSTPSAAGTWLLQTKRDLPAGSYTVRADQIDSDGKVVARSEVPFQREVEVAALKPAGTGGAGETGAAVSGAVAMETVVIKRGDNLWRIARGAWGQGMHWSTIYQANTDQIRNPHWIYPGQVFIMPKGDASWTD